MREEGGGSVVNMEILS